ncbi:MAG: hypothetical protein ACRC4P_02645, partial [Aeromonas sp.]
MSALSVQGRITLIAGCCLLVTAAALVTTSIYNANEMQQQVRHATMQEARQSAENWINAKSAEQAAK